MSNLPPPPSLPAKPKTEYVTCRVNGCDGLAKFIAGLIGARANSKDTGGVYSAFLHLADGRVLQLEIGLPTERKDR